MSVGIIAIVILFQPELRRVLERIGQNDMWQKVFKLDPPKAEKLSDDNIEKIIAALVQMSSSSTGALICLEESISLDEFVKSGIALNSDISTQLLINIFEKNTPLHDGAVIIRGNQVLAATCYLPLSSSDTISKDLGTRHRAAIGMSEVSDSRVFVVSEETGGISMAFKGQLYSNIDANFIRFNLQNEVKTSEGTLSVLRKKLQKVLKLRSKDASVKGGKKQ